MVAAASIAHASTVALSEGSDPDDGGPTPMASTSTAAIEPTQDWPDGTRYFLLRVFYPRAVYEGDVLLRTELRSHFPSTVGMTEDNPLHAIHTFQERLFDIHQQLLKEDPAYRALIEHWWKLASQELPLTVSEFEGTEILYEQLLPSGIYDRLLAVSGPPPKLFPGLRDPRGSEDKLFFRGVDKSLPVVRFPTGALLFRYCAGGIRYNALPGDPLRRAHEDLLARDPEYRKIFQDALARFTEKTTTVSESDVAGLSRLTFELRQILIVAGIPERIEAEVNRSQPVIPPSP